MTIKCTSTGVVRVTHLLSGDGCKRLEHESKRHLASIEQVLGTRDTVHGGTQVARAAVTYTAEHITSVYYTCI